MRHAPSLSIVKPGLMMTVQDAGRRGYLRSGVSRSGPMDAEAFGMANALVGNDPDSAALEFAYFGGSFTAFTALRIAVTGAVTDLRIDGKPVPIWQSHPVPTGALVTVGAIRDGVWGYVAVAGGIVTEPVLGARATHLRTGLGGHGGRALQEGDILPLGEAKPAPELRLIRPWRLRRGPVRVVPGPQEDHFDAETWARFLRHPHTVSAKRDRMAMLLEGPQLPACKGHDIVSDATLAGSVQVPGSGQPIVLMADRQTTGGYPKIATVASVDLPRLAQMPTGARFRFLRIGQAEAEDLLLASRAAYAEALAGLEPV